MSSVTSLGPSSARNAKLQKRKSATNLQQTKRQRKTQARLPDELREDEVDYGSALSIAPIDQRTTIDLFCGAGGLTEGFRREGFTCLYANDINPWAIETFRANHPHTLAETKPIEEVDPAALRRSLKIKKGALDVLVGGPPCQGFSINAPERFLEDPRNSLFKHYIRFLDEFKPKTLLIENVPGMLSLVS